MVDQVDPAAVERFAAAHIPHPLAVQLGVDLVADPSREDSRGYVWPRLHAARDVRLVTPDAAVVIGSDLGQWAARVIAWDFEVSDADPLIILELLPLTPTRSPPPPPAAAPRRRPRPDSRASRRSRRGSQPKAEIHHQGRAMRYTRAMARRRRSVPPAAEDDALPGWFTYGGRCMFVVDFTEAGVPVGLVEDVEGDAWLDDGARTSA